MITSVAGLTQAPLDPPTCIPTHTLPMEIIESSVLFRCDSISSGRVERQSVCESAFLELHDDGIFRCYSIRIWKDEIALEH